MSWADREHDRTLFDEQAYAQHLELMRTDPVYAEQMDVRRAYVMSLAWAGYLRNCMQLTWSWGRWPIPFCSAVIAGFYAPRIYGRREFQAMFEMDGWR